VFFLLSGEVILKQYTLSNLFSNIYLHDFDMFIQKYMNYFSNFSDGLPDSSFFSFNDEKKILKDLLYRIERKQKINLKTVVRISYVRYFSE